MKRKLTENMEHDFFFVHESIIYGALRKCNIRFDHPDYDDFVQIGLLKLVEAYENFPEDLCNETYFYQFTGYAFQKIRWAILDEIRKNIRIQDREAIIPEDIKELSLESDTNVEEDCVFWELFHSMLKCLSFNEQNYLKDTVILQLSVTDIARKYQVSRKTVYEWRKKVESKLSHYKEVLEK